MRALPIRSNSTHLIRPPTDFLSLFIARISALTSMSFARGSGPQAEAAGLHLGHVIAGIVAIPVVAIKYHRRRMDESHVETVGLYWHFVDVVWMFVFPLVYLMNAK